jgi:endonuclease YncB( thermonuclease family)
VRVAVLAVPVLFVAFGAAHAGDADTITFDNKTFRLDGIDAPGIDQTCLDVEGAFLRCGQMASRSSMLLLRGIFTPAPHQSGKHASL